MHYRHILEFEDNAELSAIHISDGKIVVRVRSTSESAPKNNITKNYLYPLFCSRHEESWQVSAGDVVKPVNRKIWEILDRINRQGEYDLENPSVEAVGQAKSRVNAVLESVGLKYRVRNEGSVLKPEFIDRQSGI